MSLIVNNLASDKQMEFLTALGYESKRPTAEKAAELIDDLLAEQKIEEAITYIEFEGQHITVY